MELKHRSQSSPRLLQIAEFWGVLLVPWALDFFGGKTVFTSVFGALLWGVAVALSAARTKTRDPHFRKMLGVAVGATAFIWLAYWLYLLLTSAQPGLAVTSPDDGEVSRYLVFTHAGLLAAGAGMVLVLCVVSSVWLVQDALLRRPSWERRMGPGIRLPSLEALQKVAGGAVTLAFTSWGLGFFLALLNAILKWRATGPDANGDNWAWLYDPKVLTTALLWVLLVAGFQLGHSLQYANRWLYRSYLVISLLFVLSFFFLFVGGHYSQFHEPIGWFSR